MAARHAPGPSHTGLLPNLHPVIRSFVSLGRSTPGTGLQACCGLHGCLPHRLGGHVQRLAVSGLWTGLQLHWHINCLELLEVCMALKHLKMRLRGKHVLVCTDNTVTVAYINRQGGLCSHRMLQLRAIHIPGLLDWAADELS